MSGLSFDKYYNIIDGEQRDSEQKHYGVDPSTGEKAWPVPVATAEDVEEAVKAAQKAFRSWSTTPIEKRKELLLEFANLAKSYENEFVDLLCKEVGKPQLFAKGEVGTIHRLFKYHSTLDIPRDEVEDKEKRVITSYVPLGVAAAICPWNFPLNLSAGKIAPALLTGCTMIVKPSPFTPYSTLKLVELAQQVFPPGVLQVLGGDDKLGPMLTAHPGVAKVSFTGSIATGKRIYADCAKTLKRITLELGGNDACIVCDDVNIEKYLSEIVLGAFWNSGQVCVASKRIFIHEKIYDSLLPKMVDFVKNHLKVGSSDEKGVLVGAVQNEMQYEKVLEYFKDSREKGYKFAVGDAEPKKGKGFFINPTIIENAPSDSKIWTEEPFGPIVPVQKWSEEDEVIARANDSNAGLSATVFTSDPEKALRLAQRLDAGNVFVNSFTKPDFRFFFSGHKESGLGGEWGPTGLLGYMNARVIHLYK